MALSCYNPDDHYIAASYKGVPFECLDIRSEHGRRVAEGEFAYGEQSAYADLGKRIRHYSVQGRWSTNNHNILAELFIRACESPGAGILVHPTRGFLRVICTHIGIEDNPEDQGGVTEFNADFVEANELGSSLGTILDIADIGLQAFMEISSGDFKDLFDPKVSGGYWHGAAIGAIGSGINAIGSAYASATVGNNNDDVLSVKNEFIFLKNDPQILTDSAKAANAVFNGLNFIRRDAKNNQSAIDAYKTIANWAAKTPDASLAGGQQQEYVYSYIRSSAAAYLAQSLIETNPLNAQEALKEYEMVNKILEEELLLAQENCANPCLYKALNDFISKARIALLARASRADSLKYVKLPSTTHALTAAWEIYGDAGKAGTLLKNNTGYPWAAGSDFIV